MNSSESEIHDPAPPKSNSVLTLPVIFVIGLIIYEVTNNPAMAAMAMCIKFGWEDFRTAYWLKFSDPNRGRGIACCWLYVASGLWQTAIIGIAMVLLSVVLSEALQQNVGTLLVGAGLAILFGLVFSTLSTYIALGYSHRHGVRPWLNSALHIARRNGHWPPLYGHRNRIIILILTTLVVTFVILVPAFLLIGAAVLQQLVPKKALAGLGFILLLFFYLILLPASIVVVVNLSRSRFFAEHPADCWGEEASWAVAPDSDFENEELNV